MESQLKKLLVSLAAAVGLTTLIAVPAAEATDDTPGCITYDEYRDIRRGMTPDQVYEIAGLTGRRDGDVTMEWDRYGVNIHFHKKYRRCNGLGDYTLGFTGYVNVQAQPQVQRPVVSHK